MWLLLAGIQTIESLKSRVMLKLEWNKHFFWLNWLPITWLKIENFTMVIKIYNFWRNNKHQQNASCKYSLFSLEKYSLNNILSTELNCCSLSLSAFLCLIIRWWINYLIRRNIKWFIGLEDFWNLNKS